MVEKDYTMLATKIVELVGGKANIAHALHCATRLRFNLRDFENIQVEELKQLHGVMGTMKVGDQLQVIIGTNVGKVFDEVATLLNLDEENQTNEKKSVKKITLKSIGAAILDGLSGTMGPVIPAIVASAFFKMLTSILGPDLLNVLSVESDIYKLFLFVGDAAFYFFPVIVGYTAAKKFKATPVLGILMGAVLMHPTLLQMVNDGSPFTIFGIPVYLQNYAGTIIPVMLSVWVMSYVEPFFMKYIPSAIRSVFAPPLTLLIMLPISLCVLSPAGAIIGKYVVEGIFLLEGSLGFLAVAIVGGLYAVLVMTGMHMLLITALFQIFATVGYDGFLAPALCYSSFAVMGVGIGAFLRLKNKEEKALAASYAITAIVAGTSEPTLYGICVRYGRPFIGLIGGGFIGGLYGGISNAIVATLVPASNFTSLLGFLGSTNMNLINGVIGCIISIVSAALLTYFLGFNKKELK